MKHWPILFFTLVLFGCSDPKSVVIPQNTANWEKELKASVEKLPDEDKKLLVDYILRVTMAQAFGGEGVPVGTTIGSAINNQKQWVAEQERKAAEEKALKETVLQEKAALQRQIDETLVVTLVKHGLEKGKFEFEDRLYFEIALQNKGKKEITGVSGELKFIDMFDKEIGAITFKFTDGIKADTTTTWTGRRSYNQFMDNDRELANLKDGKFKTQFVPEMIVFADGTKIGMSGG
ncbi:hypothetical protein [Stenoxybacter acetivorans]|uniref:hypothetical protein n=1 Tax=Stenoxybacter acetivorans TaxID=422441 RepID=UPI001B807A7F|nr:hypothetical protein [Stenoxybacter acetivorans]